jgi:putative flippase GtrA
MTHWQTKIKYELHKIAKFSMVGFFTTCLHALLYTIAFQFYEIGSVVSNVLAFCISAIFSYLGHSSFSFSDQFHKEHLSWKVRWRYLQGLLLGFALNTFWAYFFVDFLHWHSIYYIVALFTLTPAISYCLNRCWVFNRNSYINENAQ